ncbi:MAG TPA: hypothetical protein VGQ02_07145, partial [Candidatus Limnocylindrales bacterium]|nr:hypothetical protein [Candidatus Limnocylindrales bacterium]
VVPIGVAKVEQVAATTSRIIYSVELEGHGIGRLIAPFALRQTAKEIPSRLEGYKSVLESESD